MEVWSASVGVDKANGLVLALAGEAGAEVFARRRGDPASGLELESVLRADVPSHIAEAADWGGEMALLLVPVRAAARAEGSPELRPTDVWMWSGPTRGLERYLRFGAPVTGLKRVGGPMRATSRVAVLLPGEIFVFQGRSLEHKFGMAVRPAPAVLREGAARPRSGEASPPDLSVWRPAASVSSRFLAVTTVDEPRPDPGLVSSRQLGRRGRRRESSSASSRGSDASAAPATVASSSRRTAAVAAAAAEADGASAALTLRSVAQDAAVGILRLGKALAGAGSAAAAGARAVMASSAVSGKPPRRPARSSAPQSPGRFDALLSALERSCGEAEAASGRGCVAVVDLASSRPVAHWRAHQSADVTLLALSPSGTALVTGDAGGQSLRLWRVLPPLSGAAWASPGRRLLARLDRSLLPSSVRECALPADASVVASLSARATLHVWAPGARGRWAGPTDGGSLAELVRLAGDGREAHAAAPPSAASPPRASSDSSRPAAGSAEVAAPVARVEDSAQLWQGAEPGGREGGTAGGSEGAASAPGSEGARPAAWASTAEPGAVTVAAPTVVAAFAVAAGGGTPCASLADGGDADMDQGQARGDLESVAAVDVGGGVLVLASSRTGALSACRLRPAAMPPRKASASSAAVAGLTALLASSSAALGGSSGPRDDAGDAEEAKADEPSSAEEAEAAVSAADALAATAPVGGAAPAGCGDRWRLRLVGVRRAAAPAAPGTGPATTPAAGAADPTPAGAGARAAVVTSLPSSTAPGLPIPVWARPTVRVMVHCAAARAQRTAHGALRVPALEAFGPGVLPPRPNPLLDDGLAEALAGTLGSPF